MRTTDCRVAVLLALMMAIGLLAQRQTSSAVQTQNNDWAELSASMEKMHTAMASVKPSGDSDAVFVRLMLPHHQAAIDMARAQLLYGKDPQLRRLAQEIITDQKSEIDLMQMWQKQHESQR
jgi:uncharacterized protein (DUF305 family)